MKKLIATMACVCGMTAQIAKADLFQFPGWLTPEQLTGRYECVLGSESYGFLIDAASRTMRQKRRNREGNVEVQSVFSTPVALSRGWTMRCFLS